MRKLTLVFLLLLAGCPELVSVDDPRTVGSDDGSGSNGSGTESGACLGAAALCADRPPGQCNGDCTVAPACRSPRLQQCANHRDEASCKADTSCRWSVTHCSVDDGSICELYETDLGCANATFGPCVWGTACTGDDDTHCFDLKTSAACSAIVGCTWTPD